MDLNLSISIIILNISNLNTPMKRQRLSEYRGKMTCIYAEDKKLTSNIMI